MKSNLKELMEKSGVSVRCLSTMTDSGGVKVATTSIVKARKGLNCETDMLDKIANALGVDIEIIYGREHASAMEVCERLAAALGVPIKVILHGK